VAGVYLSYPFCAQKCTYCNFASGVFPKPLEVDYVAALRAELAAACWSWTPETVYLGGGTPSLIELDALRDLLARIPGRPWREATLEAAPGTVTEERARAWAACGINRVSLGVQSFVDTEIRRTGRKHTAAMVEQEAALLRACGIPNINIDLIAGLAGQTRAGWRQSLEWIERLAPGHVSVYILEVDDDSRLGHELLLGGVRYGALDVPGEELVVEFYETAVDRLHAMGIERYEISNFARPGEESLHNLKYWRREPYFGFGADAHSCDGARRWQNVETPGEYVDRWRRGASPVAETTQANEEEEKFFVGLRLTEGIALDAADWQRHGQALRRYLADGLLEQVHGRVRLTPRGVLVSNEVLEEFVSV
jgi:oxygen-independent coproporphyrinogen-3 oxidase